MLVYQRHANKNNQCHGEGDDNMTSKGKTVWDHAPHVTKQYKHKNRENEWKIDSTFVTDGVSHEVGDENITEFSHRLPASRD